MNKVERLKFIETRFGREFVLPYFVCHDKNEIIAAISEFEKQGITWGMRTDLNSGKNQGYLLPFILKGNLKEVLEIFKEKGKELIYIISQNILNYACNGVAIPINEEHIFFEINKKDNVAQRHMYDNPKNLEAFFIGPARRELYNRIYCPEFKPEDYFPSDLQLSKIYNILCGRNDIDEVTFSIRKPDMKVVIC